MDEIRVEMPKEAHDLIENLRTVAGENAWIYLNDEAMTLVRKGNKNVQEMSNLLQIPYGDVQILAGPHTRDWWRVYAIDGAFCFREASNPDAVVLIKG